VRSLYGFSLPLSLSFSLFHVNRAAVVVTATAKEADGILSAAEPRTPTLAQHSRGALFIALAIELAVHECARAKNRVATRPRHVWNLSSLFLLFSLGCCARLRVKSPRENSLVRERERERERKRRGIKLAVTTARVNFNCV